MDWVMDRISRHRMVDQYADQIPAHMMDNRPSRFSGAISKAHLEVF